MNFKKIIKKNLLEPKKQEQNELIEIKEDEEKEELNNSNNKNLAKMNNLKRIDSSININNKIEVISTKDNKVSDFNEDSNNIVENLTEDIIVLNKSQIKSKVFNFISNLIQKHCLSHGQNQSLLFKMVLFKIYLKELNNITKAWNLIISINESINYLDIQQTFYIYVFFQEILNELQKIDTNNFQDNVKFENIIAFEVNNNEFFRLIELNTKMTKEFWQIYMNNRMKLTMNVISIENKLNEIEVGKKQLNKFFENISYEDNTKTCYFYICYLKHIVNNDSQSFELANSFESLNNKLQKENKYLDLEYYKMLKIPEIAVMKVSCSNLEIGKIKWVNKKCAEILDFSINELLKKKINRIIPPSIAKKHNQYIKEYIETYKSSFVDVARVSCIINSQNCLVPVILYVKLIPRINQGIELGVLLQSVEDTTFILYKAPELHDTRKICLVLINQDGTIEAVDKNSNELIGLPNFIREGWKININIEKSKTNLFEFSKNIKNMISSGEFSSDVYINTSSFKEDYFNDENGLFRSLDSSIQTKCIKLKQEMMKLLPNLGIYNKNDVYFNLMNNKYDESYKNLNDFQNHFVEEFNTPRNRRIITNNAINDISNKKQENYTNNLSKENVELLMAARDIISSKLITSSTEYYDELNTEQLSEDNYQNIKTCELNYLKKLITPNVFKYHLLTAEVYTITTTKKRSKNMYLIKIYYPIPNILENTISSLKQRNEKNDDFQINVFKPDTNINSESYTENITDNNNNQLHFKSKFLISNLKPIEENDEISILENPHIKSLIKKDSQYESIVNENDEKNKKLVTDATKTIATKDIKKQIIKENSIDRMNNLKNSFMSKVLTSKKQSLIFFSIPLFLFLLVLAIFSNLAYNVISNNNYLDLFDLQTKMRLRRNLTQSVISNLIYLLNIQNKLVLFARNKINANPKKTKDFIQEEIFRLKEVQNQIEKNLDKLNIIKNKNFDIIFPMVNYDNLENENFIFMVKTEVAYNKFIANLDQILLSSDKLKYNKNLFNNINIKFIEKSDIELILNGEMINSSKIILDNNLTSVELKFLTILSNGINLSNVANDYYISVVSRYLLDEHLSLKVNLIINLTGIGLVVLFASLIIVVYRNAINNQNEIYNLFVQIPNIEGVKILILCEKFINMIKKKDINQNDLIDMYSKYN
jgi:hypothetical protein